MDRTPVLRISAGPRSVVAISTLRSFDSTTHGCRVAAMQVIADERRLTAFFIGHSDSVRMPDEPKSMDVHQLSCWVKGMIVPWLVTDAGVAWMPCTDFFSKATSAITTCCVFVLT